MLEYEIVYHADIRCYWCGHEVGIVTSKTPINKPGAPISFEPKGGEGVVVKSIGEIRCNRCHGPVFADNPDKHRVYQQFVFRQRRPRRPKVA